MVNSQETPKRANLKPRIGGRTNQFSKTTTTAPPPAEYDEVYIIINLINF